MRDMGCYRRYYITRGNKSQSEKWGNGQKLGRRFLPRRPRKNVIDKGGTKPPSAAIKRVKYGNNDNLCLLIS